MIMEIWKDIKDYEGMYQVSSLGRVKSLTRFVNHIGGRRKVDERILKPGTIRGGYLHIVLCNNGIEKNVTIHKLVALSFIPNPENKPEVNHKNGIKTDNRVENLEWCTRLENMQHATNEGLRNFHKGEKHHNSKKIVDTKTLQEYINLTEASEKLNINISYLSMMLNNKRTNKTNLKYV